MESNGLSPKSQEIGSKRKWETTADLGRRFCSNQYESPWEGGTAKHIACHSSGYQGHSSQEWPPCNDGSLTTMLGRQKDFRFYSNQHESPWEGGTTEHIACHSSWYQGNSSQEWPTWNGGSLTPSPGRQNDFHVSGDRFFLTFNPYQQDVESRYLQDKKNGAITCWVCGKEGHYSCNCRFKDQEPQIICTVCSKKGHCSMWRCRQNKSEIRACTRCGEIGHSTSTHGLSCSSCDEYHDDGECRLREVKCFICESQDHYLAQCPLNSVVTAAFKGQRENFQAALRLALSKQGNPSSTPAKCSAKSKVKVLTANKSSIICFTCRKEGHYARSCWQKFGAISGNTSKEVEESSTRATSSKMSKVLEVQDPGTAKQSSEMKPVSVVGCVSCGQEGHSARSCPTRVFTCYKCNEEGHTDKNCPQKQSSEMKPKLNVHCAGCGEEGHRAKSCPTRVFTCFRCNEEGHTAKNCRQKKSEMKPKSNQEHKVICTVCSKNGHWSISCCQQNKSENRACTRCGQIGHTSTSTHGLLSCSSCDEYHPHGQCRLSKVRCFICESQDHYLAKCPLNSVLNAAFQDQRDSNFQAAPRLALSKQLNTLSKRTCHQVRPVGKAYNLRTRMCLTCREEGHVAFYCPQKRASILPDLSKQFEESRTIATSSNLSKESEERDPGTGNAKQLSKMKPASVVRCVSCGQEGHRARNCPTRVFICSVCNEEGHKAKKCPQKRQKR